MPAKHYHYSLKPGYQLHWYEIKSVLGRGGFGITYLAQDTNLNRLVAIKEYLPVDIAERDATDSVKPLEEEDREPYHWGLERFITEAQTLAQFEHPNIVRVLTVFRENNTGYMVMRYEKGEELQSILKRKQTLTEAELKNITFPLLDGLEQVHQAGFIHRDIKPQNILIRPDGTPLLIDFGSARQALGGMTKTLTSLITPGYAPFEQYYSKSDKQGPWTDIYSLAATLYACITGRPPLSAVDRSESIGQGTGDILDSAENLGTKQYSKVFLKAIDRGLQFKPEDRPRSIAEWKADFKIVDRPKQRRVQEEEPTFKGLAGRTSIATPPAKKRNYRPRYLYFLTGSLLIVAVCGIWVYQDRFIGQEKLPVLQPPQSQTPQPRITQPQTPTTLQATKEDKIKKAALAQLLEKAGSALKERRYVQPEGDNAYLYFNQMLKLEPANPDAKTGIKEVAEQLVSQASQALKQNNPDQARELLTQAAQIDPEVENLQATRKVLNDRLGEKQKLLADEQVKKQQALDDQKISDEITQLLANAKADVVAQRFTSPAGKNALENYKKVLALAPANVEAEQGIQDIVNRYIEQAKQMSATGAYDNALARLKLADGISPGAENIRFAREDIELKMKKAEELRLTEEEKRKAEKLALAEGARLKKEAEEKRLADEKIKQDNEKRIGEAQKPAEEVSKSAGLTQPLPVAGQQDLSLKTIKKVALVLAQNSGNTGYKLDIERIRKDVSTILNGDSIDIVKDVSELPQDGTGAIMKISYKVEEKIGASANIIGNSLVQKYISDKDAKTIWANNFVALVVGNDFYKVYAVTNDMINKFIQEKQSGTEETTQKILGEDKQSMAESNAAIKLGNIKAVTLQLKGFNVAELKSYGLDEASIRKQTEEQLRKAGIEVVTEQQAKDNYNAVSMVFDGHIDFLTGGAWVQYSVSLIIYPRNPPDSHSQGVFSKELLWNSTNVKAFGPTNNDVPKLKYYIPVIVDEFIKANQGS